MFQLTPIMLQHVERQLRSYHDIFQGSRCSSIQMEEVVAQAIRSDYNHQHKVFWRGSGHDDREDIRIENKEVFRIQVKSGQEVNKGRGKDKRAYLALSGNRTTRFSTMEERTRYLNQSDSNIISFSYEKMNDAEGITHVYRVRYVDCSLLHGLDWEKWEQRGKSLYQTNADGIIFSLTDSMSSQVWWNIPLDMLSVVKEIRIG